MQTEDKMQTEDCRPGVAWGHMGIIASQGLPLELILLHLWLEISPLPLEFVYQMRFCNYFAA